MIMSVNDTMVNATYDSASRIVSASVGDLVTESVGKMENYEIE